MTRSMKSPTLAVALTSGLMLAGSAFASVPLSQGYMLGADGAQPAKTTAKTTEMKCGADKAKAAEMKCGANKAKAGEMKCGADKAKAAEMKCGADKKAADAKVAEGKCGGSA
ncbi:MAG: hypothetical protein EPO46_12215 [Lysobacter sp.]|nr:MAG: hypothetical protein EPO46_12215 [Lysobacter sp.]